ncbi:MAG: hypothetical protein D6694_11980 [Gammaproteobacteria bacterium]|nr:MAG: hypothetical protein D6694_11980 [Gammaproteobacteria bacterium]
MYRQLKHLRLALAVLGLLVALAVLLGYANDWLKQSEYVKVNQQLRNLESALRWRLAQAIIDGDTDALQRLSTQNPFMLLEAPEHQDYAGLVLSEQWSHFPVGKWGYDPVRHEIVYRLRHPELVKKKFPPPDQLRWRIEVQWVKDRFSARQSVKRAHDIRIVVATEFSWQLKNKRIQ